MVDGAPGSLRSDAKEATPTVDLIDGTRLCELIEENMIGLALSINEGWFERFERASK